MTRHRLSLRTAPGAADGTHPRSLGRDLFDSKAFAAASHHPFELGDVTPPCTEEDPELFWPATESEAALAKAVCRGCPLVRSCLSTAQERGEWGSGVGSCWPGGES